MKHRILFFDHTPFAGGAQLWLAEHIKYLNRQVFEPYLAIDHASKHGYIYQKSKVPTFKINATQLKILSPEAFKRLQKSIKEFNNLVEEIKPEIVVANTTRSLIVAVLAKKKFKLASYIMDYEYPRWLLKLLQRRIDQFLMVSKSIDRYYSLKSSKVVYLGYSPVKQVEDKQISQFKANNNIKDVDLVVGFAGRLVDWKGAHILIESFSQVSDSNTKLMVFGSGKGQPGNIERTLKQMIKEKRLQDKVKLVGFIPNQALIYKSIDIFVLPSIKGEPFSTAMMQAAAAKLPIIASRTGGTGEFIKHGDNGLLVPPDDSRALANALLRLIRDRKLAKELGEKAFENSKNFTGQQITRKLEGIYLELVK